MTQTIDADAWVYVVVQNPGAEEKIVGQQDAERDITFIPVFKERDTALQGASRMAREPGRTFEVQAIIFEDLVRYAVEGGFLLFLLDGRGQIIAKLTPDGRAL